MAATALKVAALDVAVLPVWFHLLLQTFIYYYLFDKLIVSTIGVWTYSCPYHWCLDFKWIFYFYLIIINFFTEEACSPTVSKIF